jgi:ATP-dependent Lon protease
MQESAQASLSYIRSHAESLGIEQSLFSSYDIHIHVPAGAIPKDGPSGGVTIALALLSLLTGRLARRNVAMSGELTLTGRVLPVAGIKEKVLAAQRAGVRHICFPKRNLADIEALADEILKGVKITFIETIEEIMDLVLEPCNSVSPQILPE